MRKNRAKKMRSRRGQRQWNMESLEKRIVLTASGTELPLEMMGEPVQADSALVSGVTSPSHQSGVAVPKIVNGDQTSDFPAVGNVNGFCTGTLISPTHVLTAAHCVEGVGNTQGSFTVNGQTYDTVRITTHPQYDPNNFDAGYDLAIMELSRPVVGVAPMEILRTAPQVGQMLTLVGFGEGGTSTGGFDPNDNGKQVGQTELEEVTDTHIAWNFDSHNEANTAPGDSGGPAFVNIGGQFYIAGVTSGGTGNAQTLGDYSFDTRVDNLASWIDGVVGDTVPSPNPDPAPNPDPDPTPNPDPTPDPTPTPDPGDGGEFDFSPEAEAQYELDVYDTNGDNQLSQQELVAEFLDLGDSAQDAELYATWLIEDYDTNGDNQLSYSELVVSWGGEIDSLPDPSPDPTPDPVPPPIPDPVPMPDPVPTPDPGDGGEFDFSPEAEAQYELDVYDTNGDNQLSQQELVAEFLDLGDSAQDAELYATWLIEDYDTNGDNQLSYSELVVSWGGVATTDDFVDDAEDDFFDDQGSDDDWLANDEVFADDDWLWDSWWDDSYYAQEDHAWTDSYDWAPGPFAWYI